MSDDAEAVGRPPQHSGRALVVAGAVAVALFLVYLVLGMPGMDHGPSVEESSMAAMDHGSMSYESLPVGDFEARMSKGAFVVNVHRPYEGEIDGTDAFIDYDEIVGDRRLPSDTDTPIVLYCETGRMSAISADALVRAGYTDVAHLEGGMVAWEAADMPVFRQQSQNG
jgi:rhodanese-related sulfurtransferase